MVWTYVERRNNEDIVVEKVGRIRVEGNRWERSRLKEKWMEVIREEIRACGVADPICMRSKQREISTRTPYSRRSYC